MASDGQGGRSGDFNDRVLMFVLLVAGYFYCSTQRIGSGVVLPHMALTYGYSAAMVGFLSSLFFYSYGYLQNLWGTISDRVGPIRSCAAGLLIAGIGSLLLPLSHSPFVVGLSRVIVGLGLASIFTGIYLYAALAFPPEEYPFWVGCILTVGNLGTVAAVAPLGAMMDRLGYNGLYLVLAVWAFILAGALWLLRKKFPQAAHCDGETTAMPTTFGAGCRMMVTDLVHGVKLIAKSYPACVIIFVWGVATAAAGTLQGLWGVPWLSASSGVDERTARFWVTFISIGLVVGSPLGAKITLRSQGSRRGILGIMFCMALSWAAYVAGAYLACSAATMGVLGFMVGVATGAAMVFSSSTLKSLMPMSRVGLAIGTAQVSNYTLLIVFQWGSGLIINNFPGEGPGIYLNKGYMAGFVAIVAMTWLAFFLILTVRSFKCPGQPT